MIQPSVSLGGKNTGRRATGVGSSPTRSTPSSQTKVFRQLRKLDREIGKIEYRWRIASYLGYPEAPKLKATIERLDLKRKSVRERRKALGFAFRHEQRQ